MASSHKRDELSASEEESSGSTNGDAPNSGYSSDEDPAVEILRKYMSRKLVLHTKDEAENDIPQVLDEKSIDGIVKYIKDGKCKNLITMAGAGISTSSGIPDFRSPGSGLYHNLEKYNLPDRQAIFEIGFFRKNSQPFFALAKELYPGLFKPTVCHYFIRLLHEKGLLLRHYTQNIDTLERVAGLPEEKLVEAHGTFYTSHCLGCKKEYNLEWMKERIFSDIIPECERCHSVVKPDIVFFGENMPTRFFEKVEEDFGKGDLLIIMGSSLSVQPFASLVDKVPRNCPRFLVNRQKAGERDRVLALFGMGSGMEFHSPSNTRDVAWLGDCDDGCQLLADKLGWGDELKELIKSNHAKLLKENKDKQHSDVQDEGKKEEQK